MLYASRYINEILYFHWLQIIILDPVLVQSSLVKMLVSVKKLRNIIHSASSENLIFILRLEVILDK